MPVWRFPVIGFKITTDAMRKNRVRELRKAQGLTIVELADRSGLSHPYIVRIEGGKRGLPLPTAERLATALGVSVSEVLGLKNTSGEIVASSQFSGLAEDAEPYKPAPSERLAFRAKTEKNIDPWLVKTAALDRLDIKPGQIVFVNISADAVENLRPLQCVVAQVYDERDPARTKTVMRQFVPPSLLITNSSERNEPPLDLDKGEAYIKGVIVGSYNRF